MLLRDLDERADKTEMEQSNAQLAQSLSASASHDSGRVALRLIKQASNSGLAVA